MYEPFKNQAEWAWNPIASQEEDSTFNEPTTLMPTSSSCSAQHALLVPKSVEPLVVEPKLGLTELSPGDLDQTPENVGEDANLSSLYDLVPSCSILAGMTDGEDGLNLAVTSACRPRLHQSHLVVVVLVWL
jgi:hypothetical protein